MSYCAIIEFEGGVPARSTEFRNAWGGAARIWTALFDAYLRDPNREYDNWLTRSLTDDRSLWDLAKRSDLPLFERAVHAATFDQAIVRQPHFAQYADHLRDFVCKYPAAVCHLTAWADLVAASKAEAIGFHGTSVSEDLWKTYDEETEAPLYDLRSGDKHFEVYEVLEESTDGGKQSERPA